MTPGGRSPGVGTCGRNRTRAVVMTAVPVLRRISDDGLTALNVPSKLSAKVTADYVSCRLRTLSRHMLLSRFGTY
jgi:hypothetical protein